MWAQAAMDTKDCLSLIGSAPRLRAIATPSPRPVSVVATDQVPLPPIHVGRCFRSKPMAKGAFLMKGNVTHVIFFCCTMVF